LLDLSSKQTSGFSKVFEYAKKCDRKTDLDESIPVEVNPN